MDSISNQPVESGVSDSSPSPHNHRGIFMRSWIARAAVLAAVAAVATGINLLICFLEGDAIWVLRTGMAVSITALSYCILSGRWRHWIAADTRLAHLLSDIRAGVAPIEDLSKFTGGLAPVAEQAKLILQESRELKKQMAQLDAEVRNRVANRTDAMERLIGSLRNQANRDPLTGLYNRRMMDQLMPQMIRECLNQGTPLALQMIDVDYFKDLNDTLGHSAGDEMLRALGQIIRSTIRNSDFGFRYGGDEFVILMPGCPSEVALGIADRLQSLAAVMTQTYKLPRPPRLSIGICTLADLTDPTPANLIQKADAMLYAKKQARKEPSRKAV